MFPVARKADEKIRKSEALKAKREEEKKKKLADKAAQKAAAAAAKAAEAEAEAEDGDEADGQEGNGDVRKRRCRTSCRVEDMAETDPEVLKEMRASPATTPFATFLTVDEFVGVVSSIASSFVLTTALPVFHFVVFAILRPIDFWTPTVSS